MSETIEEYDVFHAIADPTRRALLGMLVEKDLNISSMSDQFEISRTAITKHLGLLSQAKLVEARKEGRMMIYSLRAQPLMQVEEWLQVYRIFWADKLTALKRIAEQD